MLYGVSEEIPTDEYLIPIGVASVKKQGSDVTIISHSRMVHVASDAANILAQDNIDAEIIDLRTIRPLDIDTIIQSVKKTNRVVVVEEGWRFCGVGSEINDQICNTCFDYLDAPVARVTSTDNPMPYARNLEKATLPSPEKVIEAVKSVCYTN